MTKTLIAGAALACAALMPGAHALQPSIRGITPVVGHWAETTDDRTAAYVADGRKWDGRSGPDLAALAQLLFKSPHEAFARNMDPATAFPFAAVTAVDNFTGGTLRGRFKLIGGESDQIAGFAFGLQPNGDYHYVRYNTKDGNIAVWEFTGGKRNVLKHGEHHAQLPLGTWHELVIRVTGRTVRGEMRGGFLVEHELPRPVSGGLGLWAKRDAVTAFRLPIVD
jgi:hypothetical protein